VTIKGGMRKCRWN